MNFWIPDDRDLALKKFMNDADLVNLTGIYKDCVESTRKYTDFQFRPNFLIAMAVAPKLFNIKNANNALKNAINYLMSSIGIKTLNVS